MAKQNILTNKKILWTSVGVLLTSGVVTGVLVPVLTSKDDTKEKDTKLTLSQAVLNAKSSDDTITAMQKLYGLEIKKASAVNELEVGELKSKYQSASNLATFIFASKNSYQTLFVQGNEQVTNLQEVVLIISPKNQVRKKITNSNWPGNQVDAQDQFNFLITFFKGKVVKVRKLNAKTAVTNAAKIFFKVKAYDLVNLFYQFKNAVPQTNDFGYYNAYLDDENSAQGLDLFKKYLLTLKAEDSVITSADLTGVQFTKKSHSTATNTATAELIFSYQGLSTSKTISDFEYREIYDLTLKARVENKMADEVEREDIDTTNLSPGVSISNIEPSPDYPDGSVIKITFRGGTITSQNLPGLTSYQVKAQALLESTQNSDFTITRKSEILPSAYNDKDTLWRQLQKKADGITNNNAKRKVKEILGKANITFEANDQIGVLSFIIAIGTVDKTFVISEFLDTLTIINRVNKRIDAEVARKTKPTIKPGSEWKTALLVIKEDIIITLSDASLKAKVLTVKVKQGLSGNIDGTIVVVTIEVSSKVLGTKKIEYKVELRGFMPSKPFQFWRRKQTTNLLNSKIPNKSKILPSEFNDIELIKNILKNKNRFDSNITPWAINTTRQGIDKKVKISFIPNDDNGTLIMVVKLIIEKEYTISGFKTKS